MQPNYGGLSLVASRGIQADLTEHTYLFLWLSIVFDNILLQCHICSNPGSPFTDSLQSEVFGNQMPCVVTGFSKAKGKSYAGPTESSWFHNRNTS